MRQSSCDTLVTCWSKGGQIIVYMLMVQNCMQYCKPLFMMLVHIIHVTVRKNSKNASCDTLVTYWSKRGHKFIPYT